MVFRDCNFKLTCVLLREEPMLVNVLNPLLQLWISPDLRVILVVEAQHSLHKSLTNADKKEFYYQRCDFSNAREVKRKTKFQYRRELEKEDTKDVVAFVLWHFIESPFHNFQLQNAIFHHSGCFTCTRTMEINQSTECIGRDSQICWSF